MHFPTCNYLYLRHLPSVGGSGCDFSVSLPQVLGFASGSLLHALADFGCEKYFSSNESVHHNRGGDLVALLLELKPPLLQGEGLSHFRGRPGALGSGQFSRSFCSADTSLVSILREFIVFQD